MSQSARARSPRSPITRTACAAAVTVLGTSLLAPAAFAEPAEPGTTTIDLYGINDFHGRISEDLYNGSVGVASMASAFAALQAENENSLFVSAGDNIGASTFESMSQQDNPTIDALGLAGLSVSAVGNHEFDRGMTDLTDRVIPRWADATGEEGADLALGANVYDAEGNPALKEYALRDMGGVTVGFVGTVTEKTSTLVSPDGIAGLTFGNQVEAVNRVSAQLSDGNADNGEADVVVVLAHDGSETTECSAIASEGSGYANLVNNASADVDAIFSGHTHLGYACELNGRPVVQGHQYGTAFAKVSFEVDAEGQIVDSHQALMTLTDDEGKAIYAQDPDVQNIVDAAVAEADVVGSEPLGTITDDILRGGAEPGSDRGVESTLGNLVADIQLWATSNDSYAGVPAEIAFMNPGGLRADLTYADSDGEGDGVVTFKEAADVQPFANTLVTMDLTGADLKNLLEKQWQPEGSSRAKLHLGISEGFSYEYDPEAATGEHITYLEFNGEEVDPAATYRVVTNSFLAAGGDNFATFLEGTDVADSGQVDIDATVNFFAAHDDVAPAPLGRAAVASVEEPVDVPFTDVEGTSFEESIQWLYGSGVTAGYTDGTFRPQQYVKRLEMAGFLYRYAGEEFEAGSGDVFTDIPAGHSWAEEVGWAKANGITSGYTDGRFGSQEMITRGQMAAFLQSYAQNVYGVGMDFQAPAESPFADVAAGGAFYGPITWLESTGITGGFGDETFRASKSTTRGEMAAFLERLDAYLAEQAS
ncbi:5'-nucleotidase C-terminal domain-containing protein [Zhihengliuella flava]|uniref:5'-nucleotidase n=1 Tax=Zhihengliuella flava TaxID=1285193 RepID=A0A931GET6_9MICC|nr:5'-nucleotidase C-terminal domain-containing protein [Zhihengliuella flava]MBG6084485.1 5'-nucleotidase [Zhihengliuella flava]